MKSISRLSILGVLSVLMFSGILWAEDDRNGAVRGTFVRLVEREVGERVHMGIAIKPFERDEHVTVLVPRQREELWHAARGLREGQKVGVSFVTEAGYKWIKGMEAERRREVAEERQEGRRRSVWREVVRRDEDRRERHREEDERERHREEDERARHREEDERARHREEDERARHREEDERARHKAKRPSPLEQTERQLKEVVSGHLERMGRALKEVLGEHLEQTHAELRELRAYVERMQEELQGLRADNERLRRQLRERGGPERGHEREVRMRREDEGRRGEKELKERKIRRERDEGRETRERPKSERELVVHELEVMRMALSALKEADRGDAAELLTLAIRACEMMIEGRRDEGARRVRERAPNRGQLAEILSMASRLWREFGHSEKGAVVGQLAEQLAARKRRQVREAEAPDRERKAVHVTVRAAETGTPQIFFQEERVSKEQLHEVLHDLGDPHEQIVFIHVRGEISEELVHHIMETVKNAGINRIKVEHIKRKKQVDRD